MPLDRMLIESESPFMVPATYRGKRNKPSYIGETAAFIAEMRELEVEELAEVEALELEARDLEPISYAPHWSILYEYEDDVETEDLSKE